MSTTSGSQNEGATGPIGPVEITVSSLLEAGAHFGHQSERWNPKMLPYIYGARNGVHIINLDLTDKLWQRARKYIVDTVARGGTVMFVGTKAQAREVVQSEAKRCGAFSISERWLGGALTNFETIKNSIDRMKKLEHYLSASENPDSKVKLNKKERLMISRQIEKLSKNLGGIREMRRPPDLMFIVDIAKEDIAVAEARRLRIPIIALVDTNVDPTLVQFPVPSNDDATRVISLFMRAAADAVIEGRALFEARMPQQGEGRHEKGRGSHNNDAARSGMEQLGEASAG